MMLLMYLVMRKYSMNVCFYLIINYSPNLTKAVFYSLTLSAFVFQFLLVEILKDLPQMSLPA